MGLDMYLKAERHVSGFSFESNAEKLKYARATRIVSPKILGAPTVEHSPSAVVSANIVYWRKANAIHKYFTDIARGIDDCRAVYIEREHLMELKKRCKVILDEPDKKKQKKLAKEFLPPQSGFFFGSTDIDDWYFEYLRYTLGAMDFALSLPKGVDFYYRASW